MVAKIHTETVDQWPVMSPLGKKESTLLSQHLAPGERVLGQVIGNFGRTIVATDQKLLVFKTGLISG